MKYTEKIHAKRLLGMLNKKDPCFICTDFVGIDYKWDSDNFDCPCDKLGQKEAIKRTWFALEAKG